MKYDEFLNKKRIVIKPCGFETKHEINKKLFDFQHDIVKWSLFRGKSAVWADCGTGKSPIQLEWAKHVYLETNENVLILAPLAVSRQTKEEGKKFGVDVNICESQEDVKPGINITNYQKLHKFDCNSFIGVVLDESSIIKNFNGKIRNQLIKSFKNTKYKLCCTATPSPNDFMELGNHSEFLGVMDCNEMLATFFINDTANVGTWRLKKHAESEYWKWLCSWAVYLKNPSDLGYDGSNFILPELKIKKIIIESNSVPKYGFFQTQAKTLDDQRKERKDTLPIKIEKIKEIIESRKDESWLFWCNLNYESEEINKRIGNSFEITGSTKDFLKEEYMLSFSNGKIKRLVTKPQIAGFGMNWQHCSNVVFVGLSHSYEQYYQAIRRCWRFGQTKSVNIYIIISDREQIIFDNLMRKERDCERLSLGMLNHMKDLNISNLKNLEREDVEYKKRVEKESDWEMHLGDCIEVVNNLKDNSIDYSIFSPPFSSLYTYSNSNRDMGNCKNDEEFYNHFKFLVPELFRVTKQGRLLSFHCANIASMKSRDGFIGIKDFRGELIRIFQDVGFIYHSEVCIWKNPAVEMQRTKALGLLHKQLKKDSSMSRMGTPDYIITMRKPGENLEPIVHTDNNFSVDQWQNWASPVWMDIKQTNTLNKNPARENKDEKHICPLQLDVIQRCIILWSNEGDLVLSPFAGIGSEGVVSIQENRKFIGIELKENYFNVAVDNLKSASIKSNGFFNLKGEKQT